ncbi:hypothetical protein PS687_00033 [Pseudomonas fluorescens]|nr:hypothetical protein PS687_00033 [Pseudomonas fluorescens]
MGHPWPSAANPASCRVTHGFKPAFGQRGRRGAQDQKPDQKPDQKLDQKLEQKPEQKPAQQQSTAAWGLGGWVMAAFFALCALPAHAEVLLERAQARGTLNVCTSDEFPPFKMLDAQGKPAGLIMDLIVDLQQQLSARVGQRLKLSLVQVNPLNRLLFLDQGRCEVLVTSLLDTPARRREVDFASPGFYSSAATVFAPKSTPVPDWESLRGKTLCAPATSVWVRPFESRYGVQFASFNGTAEVRKAVADSRCLGAMGDDALYNALARQPEWADYEVKLPGQAPAPWGIALRKGQPALLAAVSSIVEGWHANGLIIELEQRYALAPNAWVAQQHAQARHE